MLQTIERTTLTQLVTNEQYARKVLPFMKKDYFSDRTERTIFEEITKFVDKYNKIPTQTSLEIEVQGRKDLNEDDYKKVVAVIQTLSSTDVDFDWLVDTTEKFCKDKAVYNAIVEGISIIDGKDKDRGPDAIPGILTDALAVGFDNAVGHDYLDDSESRFDYYHTVEKKIPFDLEFFNKITKGGLPPKTLNIALAGTGVGKSLFMCHVAANCLSQGKNVLYITLEMAEERIAERIDANLMNISMEDLHNLPKQMFDNKIAKIIKSTSGKLIVKEYPTASAHSAHFRGLIKELAIKKSFKPDIIFIDYLNICASSRFKGAQNVNSYMYIKSIAEELRGLAVETNVPIMSATQTTRSGFCLALDTKVITNNGEKCIQDVEVGDELLSNMGYNKVTTIFPKVRKKMYRITTEGGHEIVCSEDHLFPTNNGEKNIKGGLCLQDTLLINNSDH